MSVKSLLTKISTASRLPDAIARLKGDWPLQIKLGFAWFSINNLTTFAAYGSLRAQAICKGVLPLI